MLTLNILGTPKRREALCPTCVYAVMQKGFREKSSPLATWEARCAS